MGRPETDLDRLDAMTMLANGLTAVEHNEDALSVREAELSMRRRFGASVDELLIVQGNLACTYDRLGRHEEALNLRRDVYSRSLELLGE